MRTNQNIGKLKVSIPLTTLLLQMLRSIHWLCQYMDRCGYHCPVNSIHPSNGNFSISGDFHAGKSKSSTILPLMLVEAAAFEG